MYHIYVYILVANIYTASNHREEAEQLRRAEEEGGREEQARDHGGGAGGEAAGAGSAAGRRRLAGLRAARGFSGPHDQILVRFDDEFGSRAAGRPAAHALAGSTASEDVWHLHSMQVRHPKYATR